MIQCTIGREVSDDNDLSTACSAMRVIPFTLSIYLWFFPAFPSHHLPDLNEEVTYIPGFFYELQFIVSSVWMSNTDHVFVVFLM